MPLNNMLALISEVIRFFWMPKIVSNGESFHWISIATPINAYMFAITFCRLPFNWKTPLGFLIAICFEYYNTYFGGVFLFSIACFLVGACFLLKLFIEDITNDLRLGFSTVDVAPTNENMQNFRRILRNIVQDISHVKKFSMILVISRKNEEIFC